MPASIGDILDGVVVKLLPYGAIIQLPEEETGLVHISEIAEEYVKEISDYLDEDDAVKVKVLAEKEPGKWELSMKQAGASAVVRSTGERKSARPISENFDKRLSEFMKQSNRRQSELRRSRAARRDGT